MSFTTLCNLVSQYNHIQGKKRTNERKTETSKHGASTTIPRSTSSATITYIHSSAHSPSEPFPELMQFETRRERRAVMEGSAPLNTMKTELISPVPALRNVLKTHSWSSKHFAACLRSAWGKPRCVGEESVTGRPLPGYAFNNG